MRIAMVSEHASPLAVLGGADGGGQNVHVAALATELGRRGHEVTVYTRRDAPPERQPERMPLCENVSVVHVPVGPDRAVPKDEMYPLMSDFARWLVSDWKVSGTPDLVHAHFWMSGLAALEAARDVGIPVVQTFHALGSVKRRHLGGADPSPPTRIGRERCLAASVDLIIATCSDEVAELRREADDLAPVEVIPCGVDTAVFRPAGTPALRDGEGRRLLLTVGRFVERKGFDVAIRALPHLPDTALLIVGGPDAAGLGTDPEAGRLRAVAAEAGVADRVHLVGSVDHQRMPGLYRSADVVLSTPWYEPFGITPVEAAACGRPVVGSAVGGLLDTVVDGVTGFLVPAQDPQGVAEAVRQLLEDPGRRERMGAQARRRAVDVYSWSTVAARTEAAYAQVLERAPASRADAAGVSDVRSWLADHHREMVDGLADLARHADQIASWGRMLAVRLGSGGRLLVAGNGGSAAQGEHLTGELVGRFGRERRPMSAISLASDAASVTAILNDYGIEEVFARQVAAHGRPGDIALLLSTSGTSRNVLAAARRARALGLQVWALTGPAPNPLAALADRVLECRATTTACVQEIHLVVVHALCAAVDAALADSADSADSPAPESEPEDRRDEAVPA